MKKFSSVSHKITLIALMILGAYFLATLFTFFSNYLLTTNILKVRKEYFPLTVFSNELNSAFNQQVKSYEDALLLGDLDAVNSANQQGEKIKELISKMQNTSSKKSVFIPALDSLQTLYNEFYAISSVAFVSIAQGVNTDEIQQKSQQAFAMKNQINNIILRLNEQIVNTLQNSLDSQRNRAFRNIVMQIIFFILVLIFSMWFVKSFSKRFILNPIYNILNMVKDIAQGEGDLSKRLRIETQDEIGELGSWMNIFLEKIHEIVKKIATVNQQLDVNLLALNDLSQKMLSDSIEMTADSSSASREIQSVNHQISQISDESQLNATEIQNLAIQSSGVTQDISKVAKNVDVVNDSFANVAVSMNNVSGNIDQISANISDIVNRINSAASAIEEMTASLSEVNQNTQKAYKISADASTKTKNTVSAMKELNSIAIEVSNIVSIINDIARQTNLLALNATIEAASAGEAGKGFSVVANEVKELAKQTAEATEKIELQIKKMLQATDVSYKDVVQIDEVIHNVQTYNNSISMSIDQQSNATREIAHTVNDIAQKANQINDYTQRIKHTVAENDKLTQSVSENLNEITLHTTEAARIIKNTSDKSTSVSRSIELITTKTVSISESVDQLTREIMRINSLSQETSNSASDSNSNSQSVNLLFDELNELIKKFKI